MSTHRIDVIEIKFEPHPNADSLSIVRPFGYQCVVRTQDWKEGQLAAYVPPDYVVPLDRPEFSWLKNMKGTVKEGATDHRVKVKKFRGVMSQGLLCPAPDGTKVGDNLIDILGIKRYAPPDNFVTGGEVAEPPGKPLVIPVYDVEAWERYRHAFNGVKTVVITEKIHGANGRWMWDGERFHVGARSNWRKESDLNVWWKALRQNTRLQEVMKAHPHWVFYGEVYGKVQDLQYGVENGQYPIRIFDIWTGSSWLEWNDFCLTLGSTDEERDFLIAPVLEIIQFYPLPGVAPELLPAIHMDHLDKKVREHSEGPSTLFKGHTREGCVVRAVPETTNIEIGRVQLKKVGDGYLERA